MPKKKARRAVRPVRAKKKSPPARNKEAANLRKVLAVNAKINSTLNLDELLGIIMKTAAEVMRTEASSLMLVDEATQELVFRVALGEKGKDLVEKFRLKMGEGIGGYVAKTGEPVVVNDPAGDPRFAKRFDKATGFSTKAILCVPMKNRDKIIGVLQAINPIGRPRFEKDELGLFEVFADQASLSVENARMHSELVRQERAKQELAIAHQIQQNFLPDLSQQGFSADLAARTLPALMVGGDFYDVIRVSDTKTSIVIGDVSGKGVPAALTMVRAISEYRFLVSQHSSPAELLHHLNDRLCQNSSFGIFVTFLCLLLDTDQKKIIYSSAGHHPILMREAKSSEASFLTDAGGIPLGLMPGSVYAQAERSVASGDAMMLYTDGVIEARDRAGKEYGAERLKLFLQAGRSSAAEYSERLLEDYRQFTSGAPQHDDTTVLAIKIR